MLDTDKTSLVHARLVVSEVYSSLSVLTQYSSMRILQRSTVLAVVCVSMHASRPLTFAATVSDHSTEKACLKTSDTDKPIYCRLSLFMLTRTFSITSCR